MRRLQKLLVVGSVASLMLLAVAAPARADIVVVTGVNNQGTENVLLNPATNALTVTGTVGAHVVNFTSSSGSQLLTANPSGQATVAGGTGNSPYTQISFGVANNDLFTNAVFNINAATNGSVRINVTGFNIDGGFFQDDFVVDANGQNFFTITAINGQAMATINLLAINGATFEDIRQVRLGGGDLVPLVPVPEPGSMMLLGTGLAGFLMAHRRRRAKR